VDERPEQIIGKETGQNPDNWSFSRYDKGITITQTLRDIEPLCPVAVGKTTSH
jgi:hypothetical protein